MSFRGLQKDSIFLSFESLIKQCAFIGLRNGSIHYNSDSFSSEISFCLFIDDCIYGESGGAINLFESKDIKILIKSCFASLCFTIPNDKFAEGQFANLRTIDTSKKSSIVAKNLCVAQCAPKILKSKGETQRASIYFGNGCELAEDINLTSNKAEFYAVFFYPLNSENAKFQYLTITATETSQYCFGSNRGNSSVSRCNSIDNRATSASNWAIFFEGAKISFIDCAFVFPTRLGLQKHANSEVNFKKCYLKNINTDNANSVSTVSRYEKNMHTSIMDLFASMGIFDCKTNRMQNKKRMYAILNSLTSYFLLQKVSDYQSTIHFDSKN